MAPRALRRKAPLPRLRRRHRRRRLRHQARPPLQHPPVRKTPNPPPSAPSANPTTSIIAVAGNGIPYVETLLDKTQGDAVVDYRAGPTQLVADIKSALSNSGTTLPLRHAFDAVSEKGSHAAVVAVLAPDARVTNVLPIERFAPPGFAYPATYRATEWSMVGDVHGPQKEVGFVYFRWIFRKIAEGAFSAHPHQVVPGGLAGVAEGLTNLREGRASAVKYVFRIGETEGAGKD